MPLMTTSWADQGGLAMTGTRTYRILYQINDDEATLDALFVGPRRTVYEELRSLLEEKGRGS